MSNPDNPFDPSEGTDHWGKVGVAVEDGTISLYLDCPNCPEHSGLEKPVATFHVGHLRSIADILGRVGDQMGLPPGRADKITQRLHREGNDHSIIEQGLKEMRGVPLEDIEDAATPAQPRPSLWDRLRDRKRRSV